MNETQRNASLDLLLQYMKLFQWSFSTLLAFNDLDFSYLKKRLLGYNVYRPLEAFKALPMSPVWHLIFNRMK